MKIDEITINHNVVRLVKEALEEYYDSGALPEVADDEMDYIRGVLALADALREVLNA